MCLVYKRFEKLRGTVEGRPEPRRGSRRTVCQLVQQLPASSRPREQGPSSAPGRSTARLQPKRQVLLRFQGQRLREIRAEVNLTYTSSAIRWTTYVRDVATMNKTQHTLFFIGVFLSFIVSLSDIPHTTAENVLIEISFFFFLIVDFFFPNILTWFNKIDHAHKKRKTKIWCSCNKPTFHAWNVQQKPKHAQQRSSYFASMWTYRYGGCPKLANCRKRRLHIDHQHQKSNFTYGHRGKSREMPE